MTDIEVLLSSEVGNHSKIREFRIRLTPSERRLFDGVFLLGFKEGLLLSLGGCPDRNHAVSSDPVCNGCFFWDTPSYPEHCRIGSKPEGGRCLFWRE